MAVQIGKPRNTTTSAFISSGIAANSVTSTTLVTLTAIDSKLIFTNDGNQDIWVKLQAALDDDDKKGFKIYKGTTTELDLESITYIGEVSMISDVGNSTMFITVI